MNNLGFLVANKSMLEIKKLVDKAGKTILDWGTRNAVAYDLNETESILFFKARNKKLVK